MSLPADPAFSPASANNNVLTSQTLTSGTPISATFTVPASLWGLLQVWNTAGETVATTNGVQVTIYRSVDGVTYGTNPYIGPYVIGSTEEEKETGDYDLPPGMYKMTLSNLDTSNPVTVQAMQGVIG